MKREVLTRAIGELDDELIADAYAYKPRKRYALPRFLAAAACLVLVLAAALAMTRDTLPAEIKVEGAALSSIPIPISRPAAMALDARDSLSGPLSPMLTIESKSGEAVTVTVSDGELTQPLYSLQEEFLHRLRQGATLLDHQRAGHGYGLHALSRRRARRHAALRRGQRLLGRRAGVSIPFHITIDNTQHFGGKFP